MKRHDIQVLRGLSVLAVLFFHAHLVPLPGGYLGVDVFFVISGFLITGIILRGLDDRTFSFAGFYMRRARRLLPAAFATLGATVMLAIVFLTPSQWTDFTYQVFGSATFTSNFFIMFQTGYFASAAEFKPLLHMWSLSLEEQYYLFMPLVLYGFSRNRRIWLIGALILASLTGCLLLMTDNFITSSIGLSDSGSEKLAFFMLPFRAWELLAGSLCAWVMISQQKVHVPVALKYTCLAIVLWTFVAPMDNVHPRGDAMIVVVATSLILLGDSSWLRQSLATSSLAKVGDLSYSLYLVHWPLFSFAALAYVGRVPTLVSFILVLFSVLLAAIQYRYVEEKFRFRSGHSNRDSVLRFSAITVGICVVAAVPTHIVKPESPSLNAKSLDQANHGLSTYCAQTGDTFEPDSRCFTSSSPKIAIWGDSFAMHLIPGFADDISMGQSLVQITKSSCAPIIGLVQVSETYSRRWAQECFNFNESAFEFIEKSDSIKFVIVSSTFTFFFLNKGQHFATDEGVIDFDRQTAISHFVDTIAKIRLLGKIPIVVAPPPTADFDIDQCHLRVVSRRLLLGRNSCNIDQHAYSLSHGPIVDALKYIEDSQEVTTFWPASILCDGSTCTTQLDDVFIYRDSGHLSREGSTVVINRLGIADHVVLR